MPDFAVVLIAADVLLGLVLLGYLYVTRPRRRR